MPCVNPCHSRYILRIRLWYCISRDAHWSDFSSWCSSKLLLWIYGAHFFLRSYLSNTLVERPNVYVHYFNSLIVIDVKFFINNFGRPLYCERLMRTFRCRLIHYRSLIFSSVYFFTFCLLIFGFLWSVFLLLKSLCRRTLIWLLHLMHFNGRHELSFSQ